MEDWSDVRTDVPTVETLRLAWTEVEEEDLAVGVAEGRRRDSKSLVVMHHGQQVLKLLVHVDPQLVRTSRLRDNGQRVNPRNSQRRGTGWRENHRQLLRGTKGHIQNRYMVANLRQAQEM